MIYFLLGWTIAATIMACRFRRQRDKFKEGFEIRGKSIEDARRGYPPFLLNPGVHMVVNEEKSNG